MNSFTFLMKFYNTFLYHGRFPLYIPWFEDFSVFGESFTNCKASNFVLNWEKYHFMVQKEIILDNCISKKGIEDITRPKWNLSPNYHYLTRARDKKFPRTGRILPKTFQPFQNYYVSYWNIVGLSFFIYYYFF